MVTIGLAEPLLSELKRLAGSIAVAHLETECPNYLVDPAAPIPFEQVDLCVIDFDSDWEKAGQTAARIREAFRLSSILAISSQAGADWILKAMHQGCDQYLVKPLDAELLLEALVPIWLRKRARLEQPKPAGQILAFLGVKGGCGATTLSTHLGTLLARVHKRKTLLIDSHPQLGDVAFYLGLSEPSYHFHHLFERVEELDAGLLQGLLLRHRSGLDLLTAPASFETPAPIARRVPARTLDFLKSQYEFVLIDCSPGLNESNLTIVSRSDQVYLLVLPEVSCLRRVAHYLDYFDESRHLADIAGKIRVVLNCREPAFVRAAVEETIHHPLYWTVPRQDKEVLQAVNGGDPSAGAADSSLGRALAGWADEIVRQPSGANEPARNLASALEPL